MCIYTYMYLHVHSLQFEQMDLLDPVFRRQVPSLPIPFPLPPDLSLAGLLDSLLNGETLKRLVCGNTNALTRFVQLDNTVSGCGQPRVCVPECNHITI